MVRVSALDAPEQPNRLGFMQGEVAIPDDFNEMARRRYRRTLREWHVKHLLDTQLLLWASGDTGKLGATARELLSDPRRPEAPCSRCR